MKLEISWWKMIHAIYHALRSCPELKCSAISRRNIRNCSLPNRHLRYFSLHISDWKLNIEHSFCFTDAKLAPSSTPKRSRTFNGKFKNEIRTRERFLKNSNREYNMGGCRCGTVRKDIYLTCNISKYSCFCKSMTLN